MLSDSIHCPIVYVRWRDACSEEAREPGTPVQEAPLIELEEIGWLIAQGNEAISLAMELDEVGAPSRWRLHIPRQNIVEMRVLMFEKFPKRRVKP